MGVSDSSLRCALCPTRNSAVTAVCELTHFFTHSTEVDPGDVVETIHLEVLLPAFTVGCVAVHEHNPKKKATGRPTLKRQSTSARLLNRMKDARQEDVKFMISTVATRGSHDACALSHYMYVACACNECTH